MEAMSILELENRVAEIRARPLQLVCVTPKGKVQIMTVRQCVEAGARFIHVAVDDLDRLLGAELGGDMEYPQQDGPSKPGKKRTKAEIRIIFRGSRGERCTA